MARHIFVIDMLEGFTRCGALASPRVDALVAEQAEFLRSLFMGDQVIFLSDAHSEDDVEFRRFPPHCIRGTMEAELRSELLDAIPHGVGVDRIEKTTFSGFYATPLDRLLQNAPVTDAYVMGCATDCCVEANVAELVYRGYPVTVIRDLIDTWDDPPHHRADAINREWFEHRFPMIWGAKVVESWKDLALAVPTAR